jgi:hypothetical protein
MADQAKGPKATWFIWGFPWWWWCILILGILVLCFLIFR